MSELSFVPFPSIESFHNVVRFSKDYPEFFKEPITYRGKTKQHGTNSCVRVFSGQVVAQSRSQIITPQNDNVGFAAWVESNKSYWENLSCGCPISIFGEWCGAGIQKGTAIQQIGKKIFAIFGIAVEEEGKQYFHSDPEGIKNILGNLPENVYILPWFGDEFQVDFKNQENLQETVSKLNKVIEEIEPCDPWVKSVFGVDGIAEGVVYYPIVKKEQEAQTLKDYGNFAFKAKGDEHKVVKSKEAVQINPEVAANVESFVNMFVTEARCEQGLNAIGGNLEMKNVGNFLKWISKDVQKESVAELEASNLTWNDVQKQVQSAGKNWYIGKCKVI